MKNKNDKISMYYAWTTSKRTANTYDVVEAHSCKEAQKRLYNGTGVYYDFDCISPIRRILYVKYVVGCKWKDVDDINNYIRAHKVTLINYYNLLLSSNDFYNYVNHLSIALKIDVDGDIKRAEKYKKMGRM